MSILSRGDHGPPIFLFTDAKVVLCTGETCCPLLVEDAFVSWVSGVAVYRMACHVLGVLNLVFVFLVSPEFLFI